MTKLIYWLFVLIIMAFHSYPTMELTRVIIIGGMKVYPYSIPEFWAEIAVMWLCYLSIIPIAIWLKRYIVSR